MIMCFYHGIMSHYVIYDDVLNIIMKDNKKMTSRNTKTVLFASLIVAMILPLYVMSVADATSNDNIKQQNKSLEGEIEEHFGDKSTKDKIKDIQKLKKDKKAELSREKDKSEKDILEGFIDRLDIVEQLLIIKDKAESKTLSQDVADKKAMKLLKELDAYFDEEDYLEMESSSNNIRHVHHLNLPTTYFKTDTQSKFNCDTIKTDYGYNYGSITPIDLLSSKATFRGGYPASIWVMDNNYCTEKDYYSGYLKMRNLSNLKTCNSNINPHDDIDTGFCNHIGLDAPVLVSAYAIYDGFTPFSATEGYDWIEVGK